MLRRIIVFTAAILIAAGALVVGRIYLNHEPAESSEGDRAGQHEGEGETAHDAAGPDAGEHPEAKPEMAAVPQPEHEGVGGPPPEEAEAHSEATPTARSGPANDVARAALSNLSPEVGLRQLEAALALPHNQEQAALLHEARAELYAQCDPPDFVQAQAAFEQALEKTSDALLEEEIRYKAVQMLIQAGKNEEALNVASAQLKLQPPARGAGFKLQLLQGQLQEKAGQTALADKNYRGVLDAMGSMPEGLAPDESQSLARLAALRLTHLYRNLGREQEAEEVAAALKKQLWEMQSAPPG